MPQPEAKEQVWLCPACKQPLPEGLKPTRHNLTLTVGGGGLGGARSTGGISQQQIGTIETRPDLYFECPNCGRNFRTPKLLQ